MRYFLYFIGIICLFSCRGNSQEHQENTSIERHSPKQKKTRYTAMENELLRQGFIDVKTIDSSLLVDLGYTKPDNFTGEILYDSLQHAFLRPLAAEKLQKALTFLQNEQPNYTFTVFDALRPRSVQKKMWQIVAGTSQEKYVANPYYGSIHNFGLAIDLSIYNLETGKPLDMGTPIDHLGRESEYRYNNRLKQDGIISAEAVKNRQLLRRVMKKAGFQPINSEWWHFNALSKENTRAQFEIVK